MSTPGDQVQQAGSVRVPKRFPLATRPGFRSTTLKLLDPEDMSPVSDSILINCYAELDTEDNQYWVEKRPGVFALSSPVGGQAGGVGLAYSPASATPVVVEILGTNMRIYAITGFTSVPYLGTHSKPIVAGRVANFVAVPYPTVPADLVWAANGNLWIATVFGTIGYSAAEDIISGGPPWTVPLCDGVCYLDGVTYVMDQQGSIWGSNFQNLGTWLATTVIQAGGRSDVPVCLVQQLQYIIALKSTSLRCFYDSGASAQTLGVGSNLAWVEGADANFGCANAGSVQVIDQTLIWVTNNDKNTPQIAQMDGLQVKIISTPAVERLLQQLPMAAFAAAPNSVTNILYSNGMKRGGHRFYTLTATTVLPGASPFTLVYDLDQEMWYIWASPGLSYWSVVGVSGHGMDTAPPGSSIAQGVFAQDISSGAMYLVDIDQVYPTDQTSQGVTGIACQVDIYSPSSDLGTKRTKVLNAMYFQNDQTSGSHMQIRKSDDDYRSWSPFRDVSLSVDRPSLTRCGTFTKRALNIRHQAPTAFRIKSTDLQVDIGTR